MGVGNREHDLLLARDYKPLTVFGALGLFLVLMCFIPGIIVILEFLRTGLIPRLPSAVLAVGLVLSGLVVAMVGLVLHTVARRFQELDLQLRNLGREVSEGHQEQRLDRPSTGGYHHHIFALSLLLRSHHQTFLSMTEQGSNDERPFRGRP